MNELDQYLNARAYELTDSYLELHKDEVLAFLLKKGVSYTGEISKELVLHPDSLNKILQLLHKLNFIEKAYIDPDAPQPVFKIRIPEFWKRGVYGYEAISSYSWWIITLPGIEYMKIKYQGKGKTIVRALITQLDLWVIPDYIIPEQKPLEPEILQVLEVPA